MKILVCGEAQKLDSPGRFLEGDTFGLLVGFGELGCNNGYNDFGWCGTKAVVEVEGERYILDFPTEVRIETDSGLLLSACSPGDPGFWMPSVEDREQFGLELLELTS